jgi:hypothetical protein
MATSWRDDLSRSASTGSKAREGRVVEEGEEEVEGEEEGGRRMGEGWGG